MTSWIEPGEEIRAELLAFEGWLGLPWNRRVLAATDRYLYVMKRGLREKDLITGLLEKRAIQDLDTISWWSWGFGGIRIGSMRYQPTTVPGVRDAIRLFRFIREAARMTDPPGLER
jgi:hypothetical protein